MTSYAAFVENLILIAPPGIIATHVYWRCVSWEYGYDRFNFIAFALGFFSQSIIFNLGHCGYYSNYLLLLLVPPTAWYTYIHYIIYYIHTFITYIQFITYIHLSHTYIYYIHTFIKYIHLLHTYMHTYIHTFITYIHTLSSTKIIVPFIKTLFK